MFRADELSVNADPDGVDEELMQTHKVKLLFRHGSNHFPFARPYPERRGAGKGELLLRISLVEKALRSDVHSAVYVNRQSFADSQAPVVRDLVPISNRVDAGVVVGSDGVQGVALLDAMDNANGL